MAGFFNSSRGGKKKIADNLNLVPFIDLFSTMIVFLLSTAVWDQLAAIPTKLGTAEGSSTQISTPETVVKKVTSEIEVVLSDRDLILSNKGQKTSLEIQPDGTLDIEAIKTFFRAARSSAPDKKDLVVKSSDLARYEHLVLVLDEAMAFEFDELVLAGVMGPQTGTRQKRGQ